MFNHIAIVRWVKGKIPFGLKIFLIRILVLIQELFYIRLHTTKKEFGKGKKIFVLLSTDYSNLGDHAMTYAHIKFLKENYPDYKIIEILVNDTLKYLYSIKMSCTSKDIITLKGGGNVGIEYFREELIRRRIIQYFPHNKVIMFPQTVYFPNTKLGKRELKKTINVFNNNLNFYAFFRDKVSYELMQPYCKRSYLMPDIVLSLKKIDINPGKKSGALTCLRSDVEGIYSYKDKQIIDEVLQEKFGSIYNSDTIRSYKIDKKDREKELLKIWSEIAKAEILVTDRLHGMIFAALIGTPCIVLNTYNYKLRGQYEWLSHLNYMKCIDLTKENLLEAIEDIKEIEIKPLSTNIYDKMYKQIIEVIDYEIIL